MKNHWLNKTETELNFLNGKTWIPDKLQVTGTPPKAFEDCIDRRAFLAAASMGVIGGTAAAADSQKKDELADKLNETVSNMGGADNPLFSSNIVIPRKFRFLAEPKSNPEMKYVITKVDIAYYARTIDLEIYDLPSIDTHKWLMSLPTMKSEELTVTALDGCGNKLYLMHFDNIEPLNHRVEYDYASSDVVTHKVKLFYGKMTRTDKN